MAPAWDTATMDPHQSLETIKSLVDPILQSVTGSTTASSSSATTTTVSRSSLSPDSHSRLGGHTTKSRGSISDHTSSSSSSSSSHPSTFSSSSPSSNPSSSKQPHLTDQQQSQVNTAIQLLFRAIIHWTKLVRSPSQTPLGGPTSDREEVFRLGSPPPPTDGGIGGDDEDVLEIGRKGRKKGKGVVNDSPRVEPIRSVRSEHDTEKEEVKTVVSGRTEKSVGMKNGKVKEGLENHMSLGGFSKLGMGKMRWRSDATVLYSLLHILIQLHQHNLLLNPYRTSSNQRSTTTTDDAGRDSQSGISSWRQGLESKLRVLMQEVGNCLRGIVQTPGSAGGHEAAKICVIYLTAVLTLDHNEARKNWEVLASHNPSGIEEADRLRGIAKERLKSVESKPIMKNTIPFPPSVNGVSVSPPSKGHVQRPYVLSRASSILSLASVFSTRSRAFSSELQCKSTSSLPTLSKEVVEKRSIGLREDGLPTNAGCDADGRTRSASACAEEVLRRYGNQPPPKRRRQSERGWLSGLTVMTKLSGLHHSFTPVAVEKEIAESDSKNGSNAPRASGRRNSSWSEESSVEAQLIPQKKQSSMTEDTAATFVGSIGKLSSTLKPRTQLSTTPRANGEALHRTQSSPWLGSMTSDSTIKAAMSTAERKPSIHNDSDLLQVRRLQTVRSSPQLNPARRAFESDIALPPIDPAFLAAEANSSFTHENECAVCEAVGFNFPRCAKCGDTFCSRECRVGNDAGGNGKKHICGIWKARKLLQPPKPKPRSRRSSVGRGPSPSLSVRVES